MSCPNESAEGFTDYQRNVIDDKEYIELNVNKGIKRLEELENSIHDILRSAGGNDQTAIPRIAKNHEIIGDIEQYVHSLLTNHRLLLGDTRTALKSIPDESVQLVVTSPPYWTLKKYPLREGQLGLIDDYQLFLMELDKVWMDCYRLLVPGGRLVIVVGDVCCSRRNFGKHVVYPLHASIQEHCREIGFDNVAPIIWYKIANAKFEAAGNCGRFLGKPYEPNSVIKNDIEYILFQRKSGGYRSPSMLKRVLSVIPDNRHRKWFQQIWNLTGASTRTHPAPFPLQLAERLVRMFSFVGDTVLDPFMGTGTTNAASAIWGRHSIGVEIEPAFFEIAEKKLYQIDSSQTRLAKLHWSEVQTNERS